METRQLGGTDMRGGVLGFGGAETGFEEAVPEAVARLLGAAARYAVGCGAFDSLQTSVSIADQEVIALTLPPARERDLGVIAKRPIANAAWRYAERPEVAYHQPYWDRLQRLDCEFLREGPETAAAVALRFTPGVPGVHTAIVG